MKLLFLLLLSSLAYAGPSETDCNYYQEVEESYKCGHRGYPLNLGHRLCEKYLRAEPHARPRVKAWFPKVRFCLQNFIEENNGFFRDCDDLRQRSVDAHVDCYRETGFCELSARDERQILRITSLDLFRPSIVSLAFRVKASCK